MTRTTLSDIIYLTGMALVLLFIVPLMLVYVFGVWAYLKVAGFFREIFHLR